MEEVIREFVAESQENLQQMEQDLVHLESSPDDPEIIASVFRTIHTIKGTCGFLDFGGLEAVTHAGENLLSKLRDRELEPDSEIISALLALIDVVRSFLTAIEATGAEGEAETSQLIDRLARLERGEPRPEPDPPRRRSGERRRGTRRRTSPGPEPEPSRDGAGPGSDGGAQDRERTVQVRAPDAAGQVPSPAPDRPANGRTTVRLDVDLLDSLMGLVGELVLARNQIVEHAGAQENPALAAISQRLNVVTTRLQETVMQTRMQPIDTVFGALPRLVRDIAVAGGKRVCLQLEGNDTELDRTIIEAIKDPLTHLVRNAVDHGIEPPDVRRKAGKPEEGRVDLVASHENGQVIISIHDDGAGIDSERIRARALELSLADQDTLMNASNDEVLQLAFTPGLSTARQVTNVSGRGVGLDVVRNNIERIGGSIDLHSRPGLGTTVRIRLPMTLTIIQALMVSSCGQRFAIPQIATMELVGLDAEPGTHGIEQFHVAPVFRLRDRLLPIVDLGQQLGIAGADQQPATGIVGDTRVLVVLRANDRDFGLIVDSVDETQEIVVKPLGRLLRRIPVLAGATILGDGKVALILDAAALAQRAHVVTERTDTLLQTAADKEPATLDARQAVLLFASPDDGRMAIPLTGVAHLDTVDRAAVEHAGGMEVIQYRGEILPLIRVHDALQERRRRPRSSDPQPAEEASIVIYAAPGRRVGLVVDRIVDIVEEKLEMHRPGTRESVLGTMVIRGRVTEILDVEGLVSRVLGDTLATGEGGA